MATVKQLRTGLAGTTVPDKLAAALLKGASPLWLSSDTAAQLAEDLALCHPPLKSAEVRARAVAAGDEWRLTVVAHDRVGLLADTAAILAQAGYSVRGASVATWRNLDIALHSITVEGDPPDDTGLDAIGKKLRAANAGDRPNHEFVPTGRAFVSRTGDANGGPMIAVVAPNQPGLLAAICQWLSKAGASIEAAWIAGDDEVNDVFVMQNEVDVVALERYLSAEHDESLLDQARRLGESLVNQLFNRK